MSYYPKRPIKSFQDLEVYQKSLAVSVVVVKKIAEHQPEDKQPDQPQDTGNIISGLKENITRNLLSCILAVPMQITTAHSLRFDTQEKALDNLENAMLNCNKAVVYLEEYRDICNNGIEQEFFEEQMKNLLSIRMKTMHLQRSWKKFTPLEKKV